MLGNEPLKVIRLPEKEDMIKYPDFFKPHATEPKLFPPVFDISDEALNKMREQKKFALLFAALFRRINNALYERNVDALNKEFRAILELIKQESDNPYNDLNLYVKELAFEIKYREEDGMKTTEEIKKAVKAAVEKHLEEINEKRKKTEPPDELTVDLNKIDFKGDPLIVLGELQGLLNKYKQLMDQHRNSMRELYYRLRYNTILSKIGDVYIDLARNATSEGEKKKFEKEAKKYYGSGLL